MERKLQLFWDLFVFLSFVIFNNMVAFLRAIYWWLTGRAAEIKAHQAVYETSAHKMGIAYKHMLDLLTVPGRYNFGLYHEEFVHPEYVLRDEVSLMGISTTEAVFVESIDYGLLPYRACYNFFFHGQFKTAHKIITMPMKSFLRLARSLGEQDAKVIFIYNQGRVGSTLMTSIFEHTNRCITYSEPPVLNTACKLVCIDKRFGPEEGLAFIRDTLRILCKPYTSLEGKVLAYVLKPTVPTLGAADLIQKALPDSIPLFLYRNPVAVGQSMRKVSEALPSMKLVCFLLERRFPNALYLTFSLVGQMADCFKGFTPKSKTGLEFGYYTTLATLRLREDMRKKGLPMTGVCFEDLRDDPKLIVQKLFKLCDLPDELVAPALEALKKDSHQNTDHSLEKLDKLMPVLPQPTPEFLEEMRLEAKKLGVPEPDVWTKDYRIENSILI